MSADDLAKQAERFARAARSVRTDAATALVDIQWLDNAAAILAKLPAPTQPTADVEGRLRTLALEYLSDHCGHPEDTYRMVPDENGDEWCNGCLALAGDATSALRAAYQLGLSTAIERRGET